MARKNIFDLIDNKYNFEKHINYINDCYKKLGNDFFMNWDNHWYYNNLDEMFTVLKVESPELFDIKENVYIYLELLINIFNSKYAKTFIMKTKENEEKLIIENIFKNVNEVLDKLNYKIVNYDNDRHIIIPKNEVAKQVSEKIENDYISFKTLEYNHHTLIGNLDEKKTILKLLADEFEKSKQSLLKNEKLIKSDIENLGYLLNNFNIRHDNKRNQDVLSKLDDKELEEIYDMTYDLLIMVLSFNDVKKYRRMINKLKIKLGDRK